MRNKSNKQVVNNAFVAIYAPEDVVDMEDFKEFSIEEIKEWLVRVYICTSKAHCLLAYADKMCWASDIIPNGTPVEEVAFMRELLAYYVKEKPYMIDDEFPDEFWENLHKVVSSGFTGECRMLDYDLGLTISEYDL